MLLSCCFRDTNKKKHKKQRNKKQNLNNEDEESRSSNTKLLSQLEHIPYQPGPSAITKSKYDQEKHQTKEEKQKIKERSQTNLQRRSLNSECHPFQRSSLVSNHSSNAKLASCEIPSERSIKEPLPELSPIPTFVQAKERSNSSSLATVTVGSHDSMGSSPNEDCKFMGNRAKSAGILVEKVDELQKEQQLQQSVDEIKRNYELNLQRIRDEHQRELKKASTTFNLNIQKEKLIAQKENDEAMMKTKSETDEIIRKLNQLIVLERGKLFAEQQENAKILEQEFTMKEERLNESFRQIEERDQAWQDERSDVLKEVQRLKSEATNIIKILAMEYEEDNLSEERKSILSQEVSSLQLVVEMRTGEVRNLREQLDRVNQELEHAKVVKEKLKHETEKMEDMEQQIKIKDSFERQLSMEKSQLERNITNSNKAAQRMSQNVEELQWRIKNNLDLPVTQFSSLTSAPLETAAFKSFCASLLKSTEDISSDQHLLSTTSHEIQSEVKSRKRPSFAVSSENLNKTSVNHNNSDSYDDNRAAGDFSPSSGEIIELLIEEGIENEEYLHNDTADGDSLDEGLGDISSDETAESPVPDKEKAESQDTDENGKCEQDQANVLETEKERRPSRVSLETPL